MEYVAGRTNLACTIFVPYDCDNNCPFCTSKWMYRESGMEMNIDRIIEMIEYANQSPTITEFVITGGEPTLSKRFIKILELIDKHNMRKRTITTNGSALLNYVDGKRIIVFQT